MSVSLYLAPAAGGKTAYAVERVRACAAGLAATPRVIVPSGWQQRSWRRRLAEAGGAIGVRVSTFQQLCAECLNAAGEVYTELSEPVQYRLLRAIVDQVGLHYYAPLLAFPGFISALQQLIGEWKAARVWPDDLVDAVAKLGDEPRLRELAQIYRAYQRRLQEEGWADRAGLAWLAVEALEQRAPGVASDWPLVVVDGFDDFTEVQLAFLRVLAGRADELMITLTGSVDGEERPMVHRRFDRTRRRVEQALAVTAQPLPQVTRARLAAPLAHLEQNLYRSGTAPVEAGPALQLIEAPDRDGEVRAALRWLKERILVDGMRLPDVALLARDTTPYRAIVLQTAREFRLPVRLAGGLPLASNPAIAALLDLLRLVLPRSATDLQLSLPRRLVVEAWRSPYFDWSASMSDEDSKPIGIAPGDAERLDAVARWGRVIEGLGQWEESLALLTARSKGGEEPDEERAAAANVPVGEEAKDLRHKLLRFVQRLTPPAGAHAYREWVMWLETLIGSDPELEDRRFATEPESTSLGMVARARAMPGQDIAPELVGCDVTALRALKDVLRGLVWAEEAIGSQAQVDWAGFFHELEGAVQAASYQAPLRPEREEILVADVVQARGVPFRAVAVLGMAEGEFPKVLQEDPFLRDADRMQLRDGSKLGIELSTESAEAEFFYEAITRASERLLLTRPRLADNGADWQASPFWEQMTSLISVQPRTVTAQSVAGAHEVASWPELMESLAVHPEYVKVRQWAQSDGPARWAALQQAAQVLHLREHTDEASEHSGHLAAMAGELAQRYGPHGTVWSASRLETYRSCPFQFFIRYVLRLEPREEPQEGLDSRQLGNIYHRILQRVYQSVGVSDRLDVDQLLAALPDVAKEVLDEAPRREGIRVTAWWQQTREEIVDDVRRSLEALHALDALEGFVPLRFEARFEGDRPVLFADHGDSFSLRGVIDRIDRAADGRLCIIDYKTAGPTDYTHRAVAEGKKIQLPLYALAARDALGLGEPADGFYWHVRAAEPSSFTLKKFLKKEGTSALAVAAGKAWEAVRAVRQGQFQARPPDTGCSSYCPAANFCWCFTERFGG